MSEGVLAREPVRHAHQPLIVREEDDGSVVVGFMDPEAVLQLVENPEIGVLAKEVRERLDRVYVSLQ